MTLLVLWLCELSHRCEQQRLHLEEKSSVPRKWGRTSFGGFSLSSKSFSFPLSFLSFCWEHKQWPTQPLKNQVSPIPVLTEWLASTIGLYSTCCQDAVLQYQTTDLAESVLFASLTLYFRGQLRKSHSASVQRCTAVYWGGKVEGRKAENNPFKIHRDSCNLRTWWLLLSLRQSIDKQGLSDRGVGALEYCRRTVTLKLFVLHIFLIQ